MNKIPFLLSFIAVAGLSQADLRSDILSTRKKLEKASLAKDVKGAEAAMKESMTPDFKYVQGAKTQDAKTFLDNFVATLNMMDKVTLSTTKIISLKQSGDKGSGKIELRMTGLMKGEDKKSHPIDWTGAFTMEYRKVGGKWKTATMAEGAQKFLMDGKPVKM